MSTSGAGCRPPPGWPASYDDAAAGYDRAHGDRRSRARFARIEAPLIRLGAGARRVLEIGVGTGRLLSRLEAPVRVGLDLSIEMLRRAAMRPCHGGPLLLIRGDAHRLPLAAGAFDVALAGKGVFRYLDVARAFAECARVLRPGGRLGLHQYAADTWTWRRLIGRERADPEGRRLHVERVADLEASARAAGLVPVATHLFRSIRVPPYAVPVPRALAGRLWSHVILICRRPAAARGSGR
jgi:SAM-dependent methyltransferase